MSTGSFQRQPDQSLQWSHTQIESRGQSRYHRQFHGWMEDQHLHADFNEGRGISPGKSRLDVEVSTDQIIRSTKGHYKGKLTVKPWVQWMRHPYSFWSTLANGCS